MNYDLCNWCPSEEVAFFRDCENFAMFVESSSPGPPTELLAEYFIGYNYSVLTTLPALCNQNWQCSNVIVTVFSTITAIFIPCSH